MTEPTELGKPAAAAEPIALLVCRLGLDPVRGRVRRRLRVGIAVRAALFAELALSGRLIGSRFPYPVGESVTGRPLLDAVHAAVVARRPTPWQRWFNHVDADREAATAALVTAGRWRMADGRIVDDAAGATVIEQQRIAQVLAGRQPPDELSLTIVALLAAGYGVGDRRAAPRAAGRLVKPWLAPQLANCGADTAEQEAVLASTRAALVAMRKARPIPFL